MRQQSTKKSTTIYQRLLLLFFLALLPFFALSLVANHVAETRLREQSEERLEAQLQSMVESYEDLHFHVYSWMKVNLMTDYNVLLGNDNVELTAYKLGAYVSDLFSNLQELAQMGDDIVDIAVYMPRTGKMVSLLDYYSNTLSEDVLERIEFYKKARTSFSHLQGAIRVFSTSNLSRTQQPLYVTEITLSDELLLSHLNKHGQERYALLLGDGYTLSYEADAALLEAARAQIAHSDVASGQFVLDDHLFMYRQFLNDSHLVGYVPLDALLAPVQSFDYLTIGTLLLAVVCSAFVCLYLSRTINRPFRRLVRVFNQVKQGDMSATLKVEKGMPNEFVLVYERFNGMVEQINELMDQRVKQEKALQQAQYRELQAHIAPHFLYNSFNVLRHCILMGDEATSAQMTKLLASYFKYLTYKGDEKAITLQEEYQHMLDYLEIQKIRFRDNISIEIAPLPEAYKGMQVPPFVLQPLVENVFKHGIRDIATGGRIVFRAEVADHALHLIVRDNGAGMDEQTLLQLQEAIANNELLPEHSGLVNINQRLRLHSDGGSYVEVDSRPGEYFEARICLNIEEATHD